LQDRVIARHELAHLAGHRADAEARWLFFLDRVSDERSSLEVHTQALEFGITIAPGSVFSPRRESGNFIRLTTGHPRTAAYQQATARPCRHTQPVLSSNVPIDLRALILIQ
jgi:DNA-binding transcriptional MocR family regulator